MPIAHNKVQSDLLVMHPTDNTATALRDLGAGETANYQSDNGDAALTAVDPIPFGHKVAICDIQVGELVKKYGEVIGRATHAIPAGAHVHVHNVEGIRGRGDLRARKVNTSE